MLHDGTNLLSERFRREGELLRLAARTELTPEVRARILDLVQNGVEWGALFSLAKYHGVAPLLVRHLPTLCPDQVPNELFEPLRRYTQAGLLLNRALVQELLVLMEAFAARNVPAIPFKGAMLALAAYGDLALRDFDDLDFIVPQAAMAEAESVLWGQGFRPRDRSADDPESHDDEPYHVFVKKGSLARVDLQWVMAHEHFAFSLDRAECWRRMKPIAVQGRQVLTLAPEELLIILCVHGSKHAWAQLKWVCDVAELLRRTPDMDWAHVFGCAARWRCRRMLSLGLTLASELLDAPLPVIVGGLVEEDVDIPFLALRMPSTLLARPEEGISERDAVALYFALKDSWWERWRFGFRLCATESVLPVEAPSWFRWHRPLRRLNRTVRPLQAVAAKCLPASSVRRAIGRWARSAG